MLKTIKLLAIATVIAGSASTAFAADYRGHGRTHRFERYSNPQFERYSDPPLFEGRNSGAQWGYSGGYAGGTSTSRDTMVQEDF
jgi:hypothetical protein